MPSISLFKRAKAKVGALVREARLTDRRRAEVVESQRAAFEKSGLSLDAATSKSRSVFESLGLHREDTSMHYEVFSAISVADQVNRVLEIGTSSGNFARFLAALLPDASIHTWDLPPQSFAASDVDSYQSIQDGYGDQTMKSRAKLDGLANVRQVRRDSTQLAFESETYDLIWVDGDHTFPVVAFDVINALRLARQGGWICVDDVRPSDTGRGNLGSQETYNTVKHLEQTGLVSLHLVMKRLDSASMLLQPELRKYIAIMRRLA